MLCVKELESPKSMHIVVSKSLELVLERSKQARERTGNLMHDLVKNNMLTVDQYIQG